MKLKLANKEYSLRIKHHMGIKGNVCAVYVETDYSNTSDPYVQYYGHAMCHPKDPYTKAMGRFVALRDLSKTWDRKTQRELFLRVQELGVKLVPPLKPDPSENGCHDCPGCELCYSRGFYGK